MEERSTSSRHCLRASGEAAVAGGLRSNSLAAASAPPLAACEGALDGRPDCRRRAAHAAADVQRALLPTVAASRGRLPLEQEGERRVARMNPHPPSSPRRRRGGSAQPPEPWR